MLYTKPLNNNWDFKRMYSRGKSQAHPLLVTYVMKNKLGYNRLGITASKKIGNAVKRNRARRIIKQAYFEAEKELGCGYDVVLVARGRTVGAKSTDVLPVFLSHAKKLGFLAQTR
ncbi:ribonuclease P protein component [Hydrogenoanaerobacterium sp.]|uniref:ribonuclease P protein component n=1 Tax=Hydrogenoanaerobacterium sp. TaxID=2953763 RepID=UPI0028A12A05|nr:ribonuclease P protein component [Hydrogenoanaerobacterium sp.]